MDDSPKVGNTLLVINAYKLHFVDTSITQHGKIYLDISLEVQYYLSRIVGYLLLFTDFGGFFFLRFKLMYKKSFTTFWTVCLQ